MCALIYVIEWQKRGPPHAHILAICDESYKPHSTDDYDSIVSAEIPNPEKNPQLHAVVIKFMMHGPCGAANPTSPCMADGKCTKRFPKEYTSETYTSSDGYPHYRRQGYMCANLEFPWITNMLCHITHIYQKNTMLTLMWKYAVVFNHASICINMCTRVQIWLLLLLT